MLVKLDMLKPGSLIQSEIKDHTGKVVVKPGTKTTPLLLKRLLTWGVTAVEIEDIAEAVEIEPVADISPQITEPLKIDKDLIIKISNKFSNVRNDELMEIIMQLAIKHISISQLKK